MLIPRLAVVVTIAFAVPALASAQQASFSRADYASGPGARGIVAADFNRDGAIDLALCDNGRKAVSILVNHTGSGGGFTVAQEIVLGGGPFDITSADLNNDSVVDLVIANADSSSIDILLGEAAGGFREPIHRGAMGNPRGVAVADMDADGRLDIVYTQYNFNSVQILHGDGTGWNFVERMGAAHVGQQPQGVVTADFNHDGRRDIAVANTGASLLTVLYQDQNRTFFQRVDVPGPQQLNVLTVGDFDRNGWTDIAAASTPLSVVAAYRGSSAGFSYNGSYRSGTSPRGIATADVNNDGFLDLVTANRSSNDVSVFPNRGANQGGTFSTALSFAAGPGSRDVVLDDFNFDDQIDIATANEYANSATVLTNTSRPAPSLFWRAHALPPTHLGGYSFVATADFNKNGRVDVVHGPGVTLDGQTVVALPAGGEGSRIFQDGATGDFNNDGSQDVVMLTFHYPPYTRSADLFLGDGAGGFRFGGSFGTFNSTLAMHAAAVNDDAYLDLLVSDFQSGPGERVQILLGGPTGFSPAPSFELTNSARSLDVADLNRDGKADLVATHSYPSPGVTVAFGDGTGAFTTSQFLPTSQDRYDAKAIDVNHDGAIDIVSGGVQFLAVWLGSPTGEFQSIGFTSGRGSTLEITVADYTGDGHVDVLASGIGLFAGRGDGGFADGQPVNMNWEDGEAVDYDADGRLDIVIANWYHTMVLLNKTERGENLPPVISLISPVSMDYGHQFEEEGSSASDAGSYDPNLDDLVYEWRDQSGRIISFWPSFDWSALPPGTYRFTLTLRDGHGGESTDTLTVNITPFKESARHVGWHRVNGAWQSIEDASAASGARLWHPDAGAPKVPTPLGNPTNFVEFNILADPTQQYKIWVRLRAQNDYWGNDSIWVQFGEGAVTADGQTRYAIGTTDALDINLEQCSGCGLSGWGWRDERWGDRLNATPVLLRFPGGGWRTVRIQTREDGVSIDQVVLSSEQHLSSPPGPAKNDNTIVNERPGGG